MRATDLKTSPPVPAARQRAATSAADHGRRRRRILNGCKVGVHLKRLASVVGGRPRVAARLLEASVAEARSIRARKALRARCQRHRLCLAAAGRDEIVAATGRKTRGRAGEVEDACCRRIQQLDAVFIHAPNDSVIGLACKSTEKRSSQQRVAMGRSPSINAKTLSPVNHDCRCAKPRINNELTGAPRDAAGAHNIRATDAVDEEVVGLAGLILQADPD